MSTSDSQRDLSLQAQLEIDLAAVSLSDYASEDDEPLPAVAALAPIEQLLADCDAAASDDADHAS